VIGAAGLEVSCGGLGSTVPSSFARRAPAQRLEVPDQNAIGGDRNATPANCCFRLCLKPIDPVGRRCARVTDRKVSNRV
jgi:hypothetical protein